jgi:hypothetical protein
MHDKGHKQRRTVQDMAPAALNVPAGQDEQESDCTGPKLPPAQSDCGGEGGSGGGEGGGEGLGGGGTISASSNLQIEM